MKKLLLILILISCKSYGQNSYISLKYDSVKIIGETTLKFKIGSYFYFNECSVIMKSTEKVYDFLIPGWSDMDQIGVRILQDVGIKVSDSGAVYESMMHKKQVAIYFSTGMNQLKILKRDKTGIIFY